ncbi:hypothetical protein FF021_20115 [Leptospira noguchii]|uniref:hypothetical protein n=1 Tax=Leptospira noguchii TaxID=28182 RepID=UPI0011477AEE|nr:hypothetical protein [Leptospira noguchii]TQE63733.1 hypothetical protein FF021_20115 [Leptospira noguchii]UOG53964.1 hypothetical protein MAL09_07655 [Leptospira noguchii]
MSSGKRFAEFGERCIEFRKLSECLSKDRHSGERFALVHSSIPFALGRTHVILGCFYKIQK